MRTLAITCLLVASSLGAQKLSSRQASLRAIVDRAHANGSFDGVVVVSQAGHIVFSEAVGMADKARALPNTPHTVFRLASETKQVTALLVLQEVTAGHVRLDEAAGSILPALGPSTGRVTVKQLLQHISGLPNPSDGPDNVVPPFYLRTGQDAADNTKAALGFCSGPAKKEPGSFEYNNCDYLVLGALLEKVTGKTFPDLVQERVIGPLHLSSWGVFSGLPGEEPTVAKGYSADGSEDLPQNPGTYGAAGALYGDALDLARWNEALLSYKLLPKAATDVMFKADPKLYGEALGSWSYDAKGADGPVRVVERQGEMGGTRLLNNLLPGLHTSVVIIANTERADLFNTYTKQGLGYELLKEIAALR